MESLYKRLIPFLEIGGDMVSQVQGAQAAHVFAPLIERFGGNMIEFNQCLFYILMYYSRDSQFVQPAVSPESNKINIVKELDIPHPLSYWLIDMEDPAIYQTVDNYIQYQGSKSWEHLVMVKELYEQMKSSARAKLMKGDLIDWDQKMKNANYAKDLYEQISFWEQAVNKEDAAILTDKDKIREYNAKNKKVVAPNLRYEDSLKKVRDEAYNMVPPADVEKEKPDDEEE